MKIFFCLEVSKNITEQTMLKMLEMLPVNRISKIYPVNSFYQTIYAVFEFKDDLKFEFKGKMILCLRGCVGYGAQM